MVTLAVVGFIIFLALIALRQAINHGGNCLISVPVQIRDEVRQHARERLDSRSEREKVAA